MNHIITVLVYMENQNTIARRCLTSLMKQSYENLEIIIIDDCATDECNKIYEDEEFASCKYIVIKHSEKQGIYKSIREGIKRANGDYISILDNKVSLSLDFFRVLYSRSIETNSDIAFSDVAKIDDNKMFYFNFDVLRNLDFETDMVDIGKLVDSEGFVVGISSLHNKLFKKSIIEMAFETISIEDSETAILYNAYVMLKILQCSKKICNSHNVITFYDDAFFPVDKVVDVNQEIKFKILIQNEIKFAGKKKETLTNFLLSCFVSYFFFHRCFYEVKIKAFIKQIFNLSLSETTLCYKKMLRIFNLTTDCSDMFETYEKIKAFICDSEVKYFGFDIFDTLLVRPFFEPVDLFKLLNSKFNELVYDDACIDFSLIRKEGESACRQYYNVNRPCNEDVSLKEIYSFISENYGIEKSITDELLKYEEYLELKFIEPRLTGKELFDLAQYKKKTVFIASDMYLSEEQINQMLHKCGYDHYILYLSNSIGVSKYSGNLYQYILDDLKIDPVCHKVGFLGDNYGVDIINSQKKGLIGFHFPKTIELFTNSNLAIYTGKYFQNMFTADGGIIDLNTVLKFLGIRSMIAIAANKLFDNPYISINKTSDFNSSTKTIGYFICGMFLYGESKWVFDRSEYECKRMVHFVSRDGFFVKKAFDIINKKKGGKVKSNYLYLSRKAIVPLYMTEGMSLLEAYLPSHALRQSPQSIIRTMRPILNNEVLDKVEQMCQKNGFPYKKTFTTLHQYYTFASFFAKEIYKKEDYIKYENMVKPYFSSQISPNDVLFDVGYSGRCEKVLSSILDFPVNSLYFHTHEPTALVRKKKMGFEIETFYSFKPASAFVTREQIFTPNSPSCIGFSFENGECVPIFDDKNKSSFIGSYLVSVIQENALKFVHDFMNIFGDYEEVTTINCFDSCFPFEYYLHYAKDFDRQIFAFVDFEDDFGTNEVMNVKDYWDKESVNYKCNTHFKHIESSKDQIVTEYTGNMISMEAFNDGLNKIYNSWTWKVGRFVLAVPSAIKKHISERKRNDKN